MAGRLGVASRGAGLPSRPRGCVPPERPLDPAEIVDLGLDLDHQEDAACRLERHHIDPPVRARVDDLDLPPDEPAAGLETTLDVRHASGVPGVALAGVDEGRIDPELDGQSE